ncbi:MAG: fasciclin domain-containing protein [Parvularculaceae bacterium]
MALKLLAAVAALGLAAVPAYAGNHEKKEMAKADIIDTAVGAGQFNTLVAAVQAAGLEESLRAPGKKTVFAPTDAAFAALPAGTVETLLKPENKDKLVAILTYHIVDGKTKSADLAGKKLSVTTLNGAPLAIDATNGVKVGGAKVVTADVYASNGVIHVIDAVLLPPAE